MKPSTRARVAAISAVALAAAVPAAAWATYPGKVGRLAFGVIAGDGNADIYSVLPDGSGLERLTDGAAFDACPAYSHDGRRIAFCSNRSGRYQIWVMDADGGRQRQVSRSPYDALFPDFSPDGRRIAFEADDGGPAAVDIYVIDARGGRAQRLTGAPGNDNSPAFAPDGRTIAFVSRRKGTAQIWTMNAANGRNQRQLTRDATPKGEMVDWSPDGKRLAYEAGGDIWIVDADGAGPRRLTRTRETEQAPAWSPDGEEIAFSRHDGGSRRVYIMNADGSHAHAVGGHGRQLASAWQALR